jgi:hypothetical protein
MRRFVFLAAATVLLGSSSVVFGTQGRGHGNGKGAAAVQESGSSVSVQVVFGRDEVRTIKAWFAEPDNLRGLPPGLAKRDHLPPGLQRQLVRNGKLPPGLEKKVQPLPHDLEVLLPRLPEGRRRIVISGNIILWDDKNSVVLDIIANVF